MYVRALDGNPYIFPRWELQINDCAIKRPL